MAFMAGGSTPDRGPYGRQVSKCIDYLLLHAKESGIPYGIALAIGALMVYPETEWIKAVDLAHLAIR